MSCASSWKNGGGRAAATGAGRDERHEGAKSHRLENFLGDLDFDRPVAARLGRQRDADRIADPLLQQHAQGGRRGDDAFRAHPGFRQAEMQRVIAARRQHAVDGDELLHGRDFGGQNDLVAAEPDLFGPRPPTAGPIGPWPQRITASAGSGIDDLALSSIIAVSNS